LQRPSIQHRLRNEESLRLAIETKYQAVVEDVLPLLLKKALPKQDSTSANSPRR